MDNTTLGSSPLRLFALVLGIILTVIGIMGFIGAFLTGPTTLGNQSSGVNLLLGLFAVNDWHNWVHILSGVLGIIAGLVSWRASRLYAQVFGIVYLLIGIVGLFSPQGMMLFNVLPLNVADNILHLVIGVVSLYFGFSRNYVPRTI